MMKSIFVFILPLLMVLACSKEVGKKPYILEFIFESGEKVIVEGMIYEKVKDYGIPEVESHINIHQDAHIIYLDGLVDGSSKMELVLFKTEASYLAAKTNLSIPVKQATFANGQNVLLSGILDMYGPYNKKYRKFIVEQGEFTVVWTNAADYGQTNKTLSGTWSLKRK